MCGITLDKLRKAFEEREKRRIEGEVYFIKKELEKYEIRTMRKAKGRVVEPKQLQNSETT